MGMGPVSWPAVRDAIENEDPETQAVLIDNLDARWSHQYRQSDPQEFAETVALLVPRTIHQDKKLSDLAWQKLGNCGVAWRGQPRVSEGVQLVAASLAHYPGTLQRTIARFLGDFQENAAVAVPALTALAEVPDELTRIEILGTLSIIDPNNPHWPKKLQELVASPNRQVAAAAENALIRAGK
jgi:hypothetical protein